ncbi:MAG: hypothetical protein RR614_12885 [Eubacterium sp.]
MDMIKSNRPSRGYFQVGAIAAANLRHHFIPQLLLSIVFLIMTPLLFGTTNLDTVASAIPLERFVILIGILLLTPVFAPEQDPQIGDLVTCRAVSPTVVIIIRLVIALLTLFVLIAGFCVYMKFCGCFITATLFFGTLASAVFLGSLGTLTAALTNSSVVAYMVPVVYYAVNFSGGKYLGSFYLFSMSAGNGGGKTGLFILGMLLLVLAVLVHKIKQRSA